MENQTTTGPALSSSHIALLRRTTLALTQTTDSTEFIEATLADLNELLHPALALALRLNRSGDALVRVAAAGPYAPVLERISSTAPEVSAVLEANGSTLVERAGDSTLGTLLGIPSDANVGSLLFVPLTRQGKPVGALVVGQPLDQPLAPDVRALVELLSSAVTSALYVGWLAEAMNRRNQQLAMVGDIAAQVSSSLETREVYRLVVAKLNEYFRVEAGSLMLIDEATDELVFVMTLEGGAETLHGVRIPPGVGIAGHVAQTKRTYISNDVPHDPLHYRRIDERVGLTTERILCVPMVVKGSTIGVIELLNKLDGPFTQEEGQRLAAVADIIGVAIENARLFEFVRQRRDRLEALLAQTSHGLSQDKLVEVLSRELATQDNLLSIKFSNPYIVGGPVLKPEMCFGREPLFKRVLSVLHQNSLLLHGERRIGKTTVLRQLELRLNHADDPENRFKPVYIDLQGIDEESFFFHVMEEVLHHFGKRTKGLPLRYHPKRSSYSGREFQRDLRTVITTLCGPQPDGRVDRLVLLMDEADGMYIYDEHILQEFRRIFMHDYAAYLSVVFAAVEIQRHWKRYESPLYNLFQHINILPLTREDTKQLIRTPVRGRYDYDDAAVELIYELSSGRPMRAQLLCLEAINYIREQSRTNVTAEDVERVSETIKGQDLWL